MWLSGFAFVVLFFFYPETNPSSILYQRARRLRRATGNKSLRSQSEIDAAHITLQDVAMIALIRPIALNFQEPIVLALNLYIGLIYALLYLWFESFPIVFIGIYGFTESTVGLSFLGILIGAVAVVPPFFWYLKYVQEPKYIAANGNLKPEERMPVAIIGAFILPICLFWFAWTSRASVHWIVPIIGSSFFGFSVLLLFVCFHLTIANYLLMTSSRMLFSITSRMPTRCMLHPCSQETTWSAPLLARLSRCLRARCTTVSAWAGPHPCSASWPAHSFRFRFSFTSTENVSGCQVNEPAMTIERTLGR